MITILKANIDQVKDLQEICKKSYTKVFANHWTGNGLALYLEAQFNINRLHAELSTKDYDYFIIRKSEVHIGFVKIKYKSSNEFSDLDNCEIEKIYILPNYSGLGIGKLVMETIINKIKHQGKILIHLCVLDTNLNAIAFYEKLGFQYHSKTRLDIPFFKEELRGMNRMCLYL